MKPAAQARRIGHGVVIGVIISRAEEDRNMPRLDGRIALITDAARPFERGHRRGGITIS